MAGQTKRDGCVVILAPGAYDCYQDDEWCTAVRGQMDELLDADGLVFVWTDSRNLAAACCLGESMLACRFAGVSCRVFAVDTDTMCPLAGTGVCTHGRVDELLVFVRGGCCADAEQRCVWDRYLFATTRGELFWPQDMIRSTYSSSLEPTSTDDVFSDASAATDRPPHVLVNLCFVDSSMWHVARGSAHALLARQLGEACTPSVLCDDPSTIASHPTTNHWIPVLINSAGTTASTTVAAPLGTTTTTTVAYSTLGERVLRETAMLIEQETAGANVAVYANEYP